MGAILTLIIVPLISFCQMKFHQENYLSPKFGKTVKKTLAYSSRDSPTFHPAFINASSFHCIPKNRVDKNLRLAYILMACVVAVIR